MPIPFVAVFHFDHDLFYFGLLRLLYPRAPPLLPHTHNFLFLLGVRVSVLFALGESVSSAWPDPSRVSRCATIKRSITSRSGHTPEIRGRDTEISLRYYTKQSLSHALYLTTSFMYYISISVHSAVPDIPRRPQKEVKPGVHRDTTTIS